MAVKKSPQSPIYMQFEVDDFKTAYNAFLGRPALTKFMAIPHYAYLVLKMPCPNGVVSVKGDVKRVYDFNRESCKMADMLLASTELQELKKALETGQVPMDQGSTKQVLVDQGSIGGFQGPQEVRDYPPTLVVSEPHETLQLYISDTRNVVSTAIVIERGESDTNCKI
jgi:hypothetical protein